MSNPRILRKQTGNFLEDFVPGQLYRHKLGKTVTEGLFAAFTEFAMSTNPLSKNARYARAFGFDGLVCPPGLAMLVAFSQTVEDVSENARANLEYVDMRFGAPVYVGDTIEVETKVLGVRTSDRARTSHRALHSTRDELGGRERSSSRQRKVQVYKGTIRPMPRRRGRAPTRRVPALVPPVPPGPIQAPRSLRTRHTRGRQAGRASTLARPPTSGTSPHACSTHQPGERNQL